MRKFETLLLLSPELSAENREGVISALTAVIEREKGVMEEVDNWGMLPPSAVARLRSID
jgi:Ribosomal protein S6